jgi:hypothetical protein
MVYRTAEMFLHKKWQSKDSNIASASRSRLFEILKHGDPDMAAHALQLLFSKPLEYHEVMDFARTGAMSTCAAWVAPFAIEQCCVLSRSHLGSLPGVMSCIQDPSFVIWILESELSSSHKNDQSVDTLMNRATEQLIDCVGVEKTFETLVEHADISDLFQNLQQDLSERIIRVLATSDRPQISDVIKIACVFLLYKSNNGNRIVKDVLTLQDQSEVLQSVIIHAIRAFAASSPANNQLAIDLLLAIINQSTTRKEGAPKYKAGIMRGRPPMPRSAPKPRSSSVGNGSSSGSHALTAVLILKYLDYDVSKIKLDGIPGYPRRWDGRRAPPKHIREAILRYYFYTGRTEAGTDPALFLESQLLAPYDEPRRREEPPVKIEIVNNIEIIGPFEAGRLHGSGSGTYMAYKIYVEPVETTRVPPAGARRYATVVAFVCTFGPFATIQECSGYISNEGSSGSPYIEEEADIKKYTAGKKLPSSEAATKVMTAWLKQRKLEIVSYDDLREDFGGLNVYYFGSRKPRAVYELLFHWTD